MSSWIIITWALPIKNVLKLSDKSVPMHFTLKIHDWRILISEIVNMLHFKKSGEVTSQEWVLSHLDYCPAVWSSEAKKDLSGKICSSMWDERITDVYMPLLADSGTKITF